MMKKEKEKGLGMSPKRAFLSAFSFTLLHYIKHIEETIKTCELVTKGDNILHYFSSFFSS